MAALTTYFFNQRSKLVYFSFIECVLERFRTYLFIFIDIPISIVG